MSHNGNSQRSIDFLTRTWSSQSSVPTVNQLAGWIRGGQWEEIGRTSQKAMATAGCGSEGLCANAVLAAGRQKKVGQKEVSGERSGWRSGQVQPGFLLPAL